MHGVGVIASSWLQRPGWAGWNFTKTSWNRRVITCDIVHLHTILLQIIQKFTHLVLSCEFRTWSSQNGEVSQVGMNRGCRDHVEADIAGTGWKRQWSERRQPRRPRCLHQHGRGTPNENRCYEDWIQRAPMRRIRMKEHRAYARFTT